MSHPNEESARVLRESEHFKSLLEHEGFRLLVAEAQKEVCSQWDRLLTVDPKDLQRIQGFIEGANFVLEYANAQVVQAKILLERQEANRAADLESVLAAQAAQRERTQRRVVYGASLD